VGKGGWIVILLNLSGVGEESGGRKDREEDEEVVMGNIEIGLNSMVSWCL
jgi:hypothetical protein